MKKIQIAHFGNFDISANRYIDLFENENISKVKIFIEASKADQIKDIFLGIDLYSKNEIKDKLEIHIFDLTFIDKILRKFQFILNRYTLNLLSPIMFLRLKFLIRKNLKLEDKVWIGENDYDGHNLLHCCIEKLLIKNFVVKNYKETRFRRDYFERKSFDLSDALIFPHNYYRDFFQRLYGSAIFEKKEIYYSDQDQRSRYHYELVKNLATTKHSFSDGKIHVAIVVGQVANEACDRSGNRYVIYNTILDLLNNGFIVHLFVKSIIKSRSDPLVLSQSDYHDLQRDNENFIMSFEPMTLGSTIYKEIVKCDFGYLHDDVDKINVPLFEFQKINIPNRYYEYLVAGLIPIALKRTTFCYQNILLQKTGLVLNDFTELKLPSSHNYPKREYKNDFPDVFMDAIEGPKAQLEEVQ